MRATSFSMKLCIYKREWMRNAYRARNYRRYAGGYSRSSLKGKVSFVSEGHILTYSCCSVPQLQRRLASSWSASRPPRIPDSRPFLRYSVRDTTITPMKQKGTAATSELCSFLRVPSIGDEMYPSPLFCELPDCKRHRYTHAHALRFAIYCM